MPFAGKVRKSWGGWVGTELGAPDTPTPPMFPKRYEHPWITCTFWLIRITPLFPMITRCFPCFPLFSMLFHCVQRISHPSSPSLGPWCGFVLYYCFPCFPNGLHASPMFSMFSFCSPCFWLFHVLSNCFPCFPAVFMFPDCFHAFSLFPCYSNVPHDFHCFHALIYSRIPSRIHLQKMDYRWLTIAMPRALNIFGLGRGLPRDGAFGHLDFSRQPGILLFGHGSKSK